MLSEKQVEEYHENGFTIMDYKLSKNDLDYIKIPHTHLNEKPPEYTFLL